MLALKVSLVNLLLHGKFLIHFITKNTKVNTKGIEGLNTFLFKTTGMKDYTEDELAKIVFEAALKVHKKLGPGLLENVYLRCLAYEVAKSGVEVVIESLCR